LYLWSVPQAEAPGYMHLPLLSEKKLILDNDHRIRSHADEFRARPFPVSDVRRRFVTLIAAGWSAVGWSSYHGGFDARIANASGEDRPFRLWGSRVGGAATTFHRAAGSTVGGCRAQRARTLHGRQPARAELAMPAGRPGNDLPP